MVVSRSDSKRRKKEEVDSIRESPKRTKVHAQRKFAQGSHLNSPVLTPVKDKDKTKYNGTAPTAELLPIKRPKTEQFVNFLVFRGSNMLPKSLEFFNEPSIPEPLAGEEESKRDGPSTSGGSSRAGHRTSDKHGDQAGGVAKAEARNKNRSKSTAAVQALKKKYQEQRMNKEKRSLTKLALKVKGKNMMRTRSAGPLEEKPAAAAAALQKKPVRTTRLVTAVKPKVGSATRKPVLRKPPQAAVVKRVPSKSSVTRGGLRSGGGLPPGSDHGLKTERKAKKVIKMKPVSLKKSVKKPAIASSLSDFSSDDDQPLVKKQRVVSKASILASRVTTRSRLMTKPSTSQITSSRPPRKTKEAATLFMEMLKKDLRSPDEEEDNADAMSVDSFVETPKRTERRGSKDSIDNIKSEKKALIKPGKKETKPNESKLPINKNRKLPDQPVSRLSSLKTRTLRRNSYILVSKEIELKRLKSSRAKLISRMSSRSSSKEMPRDNSNEEDKIVSKGPISERDNRRERRSSTNPIKSPESKVKQQKIVTKDIESSKKSSKKKVPETNFDDSDEEPLGKKVNQITTASVAKVVKKPKPTNEKEDADETNVLEQKLTRRRSVNALHDSSKEDLKQTAQTTVKAQQVSKITSSSVTENRGKGKSETTNKAKICDNDTATPNTKSKQVTGSANETSTSIIQKPKETDKSTIKNKTQTEKKVSKSTVKDSENEKKLKSQENSHITLEKEKQEVKNMKKSDPKKSSGAKGNEADLNFTSKEVGKVAKQKNSTDNFSKTDIGSAVQISKDNSEKNNTLDKITSRKNANPLDKEVATSKSKNDSVSVSTISEKTVIDRESCADIESPESNNIVPSKERSLDSKISVHIKNNNKPALDSGTITLLTKSNKTDSEERISVSSTNLGTKKKKQPTSKINALNNLSCSDSPQTTKREIPDEQIAQKDVDEKNKMLFKGKSGDVDSNNTSPKGWSSTDVICQQTILTNNTEELAKDNRSCSVISKDITLKVESQNSGHKQIPSSSSQIISNEKSQESREVIPRAPNHDGTSSKITKYNVVDKSNDKNSSTNSSKLVNIMKDVAEDITKMSNSGNSSNILASTESPQIVNSQPCHIDSCNKSLSSIENELILTSKTISGTSIVSSVKNSSNFMPENGNLGPKNIPMSKDTHPLQVTPTKQQPTTQSINTSLDEKHKHKCVVSEPISKNFTLEGKPLPPSPALLPSDFKGKISEHVITTTGQTHDFKTDDKKIAIKEEKFVDTSSKLGSQIKSDVLDMSDKVSSAVETLMSLKNVQKIDEKSFTIQTGGWNIKSGPTFDVEHKRAHEPDFKRLTESEPKHVDTQDCKKIKVKEGEVKRVTIQEPEFKRFHAVETDVKRSNPHESDFRRFHIQDHKPRPEHPQVLKGCSNPKSMLKPGTLIDIAGISHSPEIMTPLRPGVDGEIIPMNRPIRPIGQEIVDPFKVSAQGFKPYDPRIEPSTYGYRWQSSNSEKNVKPELLLEKDASDSKSKTPVNESAWRQAFKNVKDPKSINNAPSEKPVVKKQLSVTALAKKHKSKSEIVTEKNMLPQTSASIPFLRHNKPFLGPSPTKTKDAGSSGTDVKKSISNDVDPASLREKEAEVEEFLRQCGEYSRSLAPAITPVNSSTAVRGTEISSIGSIKAPYLPSHGDSSNIQENSASPSEPVLSHVPDVKCPTKQLPSHEQSETGLLFASDSARRANSPLKYEKRQISTELSPYGKSSLTGSTISQPEQPIIKQTSLSSSKQDQTINIFQIDSVRRSNSPKSFTQKSAFTTTDLKSKFDDSSFPTSSPVSQTVQQVVTANLLVGTQPTNTPAKLPLPDKSRHFSPNRSSQNVVTDNLFKDSNLTKRTKSPTIFDSYPYQSSSPRGNSINRNTNSPVFGKCSTPNIFKEIVPAKRSYSPTFPQTSQNEGETVPNLFTQNPNFRRSVSPLSNRTGFSKLGTSKDSKDCNSETTKKTDVIEQKKVESCLQDGPKTFRDGKAYVTSTISSVVEQKPMSPTSTQNTVPVDIQQLQSSQSVVGESLVVKEEAVELKGTRNQGDFIACENTLKPDQPEKPSLPSQEIESEVQGSNISLNTPGMSEAKHRLPLAVEQTLKKLGQTRSPQNKKPTLPQKVKFSEQNVKNIQSQIEGAAGPVEASTGGVNWRGSQSPFVPKLTTGIYSHNQEEELDLMQKKKVNMSAEEIKRWLNDSSTSEIEHRVNCGILENNTCECEYRNTLTPNLQSIDLPTKFETTSKSETTCVDNSDSNQFSAIDTPKKTISSQINSSVPEIFEAKHSFTAKEKDVLRDIKKEESVKPEAVLVSKHEPAKSVSSDKNSNSNQLKDEGLVSIKNFCVPVPVGGSENIKQPPTTPPLSKLRTFRLPNKNPDVEPKPNSTDIIEVCPPARDDASSSNDLSSSNEETPEKSHSERKSIFHQRRSTLKVKERRELLAPSVNAFSPENESSVYAFDPELPPTSTPFRRSKGKDGKSTCTTTDDEDLTPSSNSIAVQVNFDNEAVLECSTQTDVQEGDDDDTHTFYIPLQQSAADTNKPPLIQGVAVKVDTEGPDQKVIMRAKLVTKPLSTFSQSSSSPRGLIGTRSGKPEQKVRPLSVKPPVGTVQPTARPKPKPVTAQEDLPGPSKATPTCSPQAARLAKRIKSKAAVPSTSAENHPPKVPPAKLVEAPTFYPTEKEFEDPLEYISSITPQAEKYGLCRVVPPSNFKPECKVSDDMRFTAYNQYIHKMLHRWGPNVKEMLAIKKYLATQSIALTHPPWIGGMEVDLPRLYQTVQQCGGLKEVIEKKRWHRVADLMKIPKSAQDRVTKLDDIYCKFLLPYDTLSHVERTQLFEGVERDWIEREKRVANQQESSATDEDDESDSDSDSDIDECIVKGRSMALSGFYRIARNTMSMWFPKTDTPSAADVELEFWKHVASRQHHVCVHSGSIDSGAMGYGFPTGKNSSTSRHPWNLKMLTNNPGSILRFLGPLMGVTVPTLHVGMLFSACCWYRDPHGLPWIEYLHTGASKIWYGIPDSSSNQFRDAVMSIVPRLCRDKTLWLASDTAMVPPPLLVEKGVSLSRIVQDPGQFIIVFPKAFTSSICTGYLVSESVYFAQPSWLSTAQALFNDMRESSEPTVFSLEKLLFSIVNDSRSNADVLNQILSIVVSLRDGEIAGRRQLEELGLNTTERLSSRRKGKARPAGDGEEDLECDECRMTLYISWMSNSQDSSVYCLPHAVELLSNKRSLVKHCTLVYAFSEDELEELVEKLKSRVENKNQKKSVSKSGKS